ncbi:hypothetical protein [Sulfurimonas sp.]|uniref:hypothetical protein n=1 Tax=Sulfurimonas sp. TaxID=2022749 RepID=UPI003D11501A
MKKIFVILLISINLFAWEVNTHRAIDRTALEKVDNLNAFISATGVGSENYIYEEFEDYDTTYFLYVMQGEKNGLSELNQTFSSTDYKSLLEAGTILEDAQWTHSDLLKYTPNPLFDFIYYKYDQADGRFLNHFYNPQVFDGNAVEWAYNAGRNLYDYTTTKETHQWQV